MRAEPFVRPWPRRGLALACTTALICLAGCATRMPLDREQWTDGRGVSNARIVTKDGLEYRFDRVRIAADSLYGETTFQIEREDPASGTVEFEERVRTRSFARDRIDRLEIGHRDPGKTILAGAGVAAVALFVKGLSETEATNANSGGSHTKPDPRR